MEINNEIHNITIDGKNCNPSMHVTIKEGDWDYPRYMTDVAERIIYDWKFDEQCRKARENRSRRNTCQKG